jgi:hypothetical protein
MNSMSAGGVNLRWCEHAGLICVVLEVNRGEQKISLVHF